MTKNEIVNSSDYIINKMVKIAGTNYDRRRKVTKSMKRRMIQMYESGKNISYIATYFNVSYDSVKRAVNPMFNETEKARKRQVAKDHNYYSYNSNSFKERANYKRELIKNRKNVIFS